MRALPGLRRLPLPGSRLRGAARGEARSGSHDSLRRIAGHRRAAARADRAGRRAVRLPQQDGVLVRAEPEDGPTLGLHRAGRWDEVLEIERCWLTTDARQPRSATAIREWAREERLPAYDQATAGGLPPPPRRPRRAQHRARRSSSSSRTSGERFDRERLIEVLTEFPEVRSIHWTVNDTPAEVTNLPTELLWGEEAIEEEIGGLRFRVRPNAFLQTNTRDGRAALRARRARSRARPAARPSTTSTAASARSASRSPRDALTVWGIEISEESVACAIENAELNAIGNAAFFAGNVGQVLRDLRDRAGEPGRRRRRPAARRARREGAEAPRRARRAAHRLRLVQPDHARRRPEAPHRGVRLPARAHAAGRHVPAHAARRVGLAARAYAES